MTEDDRPIYDIETDWEPCNSGKDKRIFFVNKKLPSLFRIVDMANETIIFSDIGRIIKITDINKVLIKEDDPETNKLRYASIANKVLDEIVPISMPYKPEHYKCFIESFPGYSDTDDILGILYFKEEFGVQNMIKAYRFYRLHIVGELGPVYEEINDKIYNDLKEKWLRRFEEK